MQKALLLFLSLFMPCLCVSNNTPEEMDASTLQESEYGASLNSEYMNPGNELDVMSSHSSEENESELKNSKKERIAKKKNSNPLAVGAMALAGGGALLGLGVLAKHAIWDKKNKDNPTETPAATGIGGNNPELPLPPIPAQEVMAKSCLRLFDNLTPPATIFPINMLNSSVAVSWGYDNNWPNVRLSENGVAQIEFTPYSNMPDMTFNRHDLDQRVSQSLTTAINYIIAHHKHVLLIAKADPDLHSPTHHMVAWHYLCQKLYELFFNHDSPTIFARRVKNAKIQINLFFEPFFNDNEIGGATEIWNRPCTMATFGINDNDLDKNYILGEIGVWLNSINTFLSEEQIYKLQDIKTSFQIYIEPLLLR